MSKKQLGLTTLGMVLMIVLLLLAFGSFGGGYYGWYPHGVGNSFGGFLLIVLVILFMAGHL